jgi:hypothetical protein
MAGRRAWVRSACFEWGVGMARGDSTCLRRGVEVDDAVCLRFLDGVWGGSGGLASAGPGSERSAWLVFRSLIRPCTLHRHQHQTLCQLFPRPMLVPLSPSHVGEPLPVGVPIKFIIQLQPTSRIYCIDAEETICHGGDRDLYREEAGFWHFVELDATSQLARMADMSTTEVASRDR